VKRLRGPLATTAALAIAAAVVLGASIAPDASAQGRGATPPKPRTTRPAPPRKPAKAEPVATATDAGAPLAARAEATSLSSGGGGGGGGGGAGGSLDAGAVEARTLDGGSRVFRFGEVEIEARLRNPQLVYFLRRVRAEFAAGDLGHRTFMRELSETRKDPSF
jgi:hypothetical protein